VPAAAQARRLMQTWRISPDSCRIPVCRPVNRRSMFSLCIQISILQSSHLPASCRLHPVPCKTLVKFGLLSRTSAFLLTFSKRPCSVTLTPVEGSHSRLSSSLARVLINSATFSSLYFAASCCFFKCSLIMVRSSSILIGLTMYPSAPLFTASMAFCNDG